MQKLAVIGAAAFILASFLSVFAVQVGDGYRRVLSETSDVAAMLTQIASDHAYRSFRFVEQTLEATSAALAVGNPDLDREIADSTLVREIAVLDAGGTVIRSTSRGSVGARPFGEADLDRARAHPGSIVFGPLARGRNLAERGEQAAWSGRHLLPALLATGTGGFVAVGINPSYFTDVYTPVVAAKAFAIDLLSLRGDVIAASAGSRLSPGMSQAGVPPFDGTLANRQSGRFTKADGGRALAAYRATPQFPFVTMVSVPREAVLRDWRGQTIQLSAVLALVVLALAVGTVLLVRQIGVRERQQRELAEAERLQKVHRLLSAIVDAPSSLTAIVTPQLDIVRANESFMSSLGCTTRNLAPALGRPDVFGGEKIAEFAAGGAQPAEIEFDLSLSKGGGGFTKLRFRMFRHDFADIGICLVLVGHDETDRRALETAIAQSAKLITLGEMATGIAHELNQPLNVIKMAAQSARFELESPPDAGAAAPGPEAVEFIDGKLQRIEEQVDRAAGIIGHMRVFGRAPATPPQTLDIRLACEGAAGLVRGRLQAVGIDVAVVDPGEPLPVSAHRSLIEQVIVNLVTNARDAIVGAGRASGDVRIRPFRAEDGKVVVLVSDDGPGVPASVRGRLFEPFFTTKPTGQGVGLGLATSFGIVKECGGSLVFVDEGPGATFRIELPPAD